MFLRDHGCNILIFKSMFQKNENRFHSLVLKIKQQEAIQLPCVFPKFVNIYVFLIYESN